MLSITSSLLAANALAILGLSLFLQDGLVGAGVGSIVGKVVVHGRERIGGGRSPQWIRQVELAWTGFGCMALMLSVALR